MLRLRFLLVPGLLALAFVASGLAAPAKLNGFVGPGFTIMLKNAAGAKVTTLKPGTYVFAIADKASDHNFHLSGPGVNKALTGIAFKGTKLTAVTLKAGTYRYVCDVHSAMRGSFKVG